jgi:hypothetical protein
VKKLINNAKTIGIIGLAKNTGKTTTMNKLIDLYPNLTLGLTSIGLDGEDLDQVNFLPKPKINFKKGMICATASACLEEANIKFEVILKTKFMTALGYVYIVKILEEGMMTIAGPTTNNELNEVIILLNQYADKVFIDGAFDRMTFANLKLLDKIILTTGASYHNDMDETIRHTKQIFLNFNLEKTKHNINIKDSNIVIKYDDLQQIGLEKDFYKLIDELKLNHRKIEFIHIKGAITTRYLEHFIKHQLSDFILIVEDPTKLMFDHQYFSYLNQLNIKIEVINQCIISFITINPFNPNGYHYDKDEFLNKLKKEVSIPIYNVLDMEKKECQS